MAEEFYQRSKAPNIARQAGSMQGPDRSQEVNFNNNKAQRLVSALANFGAVGSNLIGQMDKGIKDAAIKTGMAEATAGEQSSAGSFGWGAETQQDAYDTVKADLEVRNMPSQIEEMMKVDSEIKKPLDEMTPEERRVAYQRNRTKWFEQAGINKQPYFAKALALSDEVMNKHLGLLDQRSVKLRQERSLNDISMIVGKTVRTFKGDPSSIDADIESRFSTFATSAGSNSAAEQAVLKGVLSEVIANPMGLEAVNYLNSEQAQKRFGHTEGFETVVRQANKYATKAKDAAIAAKRSQDEQGFYINLSGDVFENEEDVKGYLTQTSLDDKTQFQLLEKARKYLKANQNASAFDEAYRAKNRNVVNSVSDDELNAGFARHVGEPTNLTLHEMTGGQRAAFNEWVSNSYALPKWLTDSANSPLNNGDRNALDSAMVFYSNLKNDLGPSAVNKVFKPEQSAKIELWSRLSADSTLTDKERKQTLDRFDEASKPNAYGVTLNSMIRNELEGRDSTVGAEINSWVKEGGSSMFGGPDDMQPLFSTRDSVAQSYAKDYISHLYAINRMSGIADQEVALDKAKQSFRMRNTWVDYDAGASYIPIEYSNGAEDFKDKSMQYLEQAGILTKIATERGIPTEELKSQVYLAPSSSYNVTRKLSVYVKDGSSTEGTETPYSFTAKEFRTGTSIFKLKEREEIERLYKTQQANPEYRKMSEKIQQKKAVMRTFGFGMN